LKGELLHAQAAISECHRDLRQKEEQLLRAEHERDIALRQQEENRGTWMNRDDLIRSEVTRQVKEHERKVADDLQTLADKDTTIRDLKQELQLRRQHEAEKDNEILKLKKLNNEYVKEYGLEEAEAERKEAEDEAAIAKDDLRRKNDYINTMNQKIEELMSENRYLRKRFNVGDDFGLDLESIVLSDKETLEQYKARVRILEMENAYNQEERTKLLYHFRMLADNMVNDQKYQELTLDQQFLVLQYIENLKNNSDVIPLNDRSRELQKENDRLQAEIQALERQGFRNIEEQMRKMMGGAGSSGYEIKEALEAEKNEIRKMLADSGSKGDAEELRRAREEIAELKRQLANRGPGFNNPLQFPPVPLPGAFGNYSDISEGYSYRFDSKLPVASMSDDDKEKFDAMTKRYECAALQLQLIECLELLQRKDDELRTIELELEDFRDKYRECLLVQDELYRSYVREEGDWKQKEKDLNEQYKQTLQALEEERRKVDLFEDAMRAINSKSPHAMEEKVIEMNRNLSVIEVNHLRLSFKYDALQEEFNALRQLHDTFEEEVIEKDGIIQEKINRLKTWKAKGTNHMTILFKKLRNSMNKEDYENISRDLQLLKEKETEWQVQRADLLKKNADLEALERKNAHLKESVDEVAEQLRDAETEITVLSSRLANVDTKYRWERNVFNKLVLQLKNNNISPSQAFELFDQDGNGKLTRTEFMQALKNLKIDLKGSDIDVLMRSIDRDNDGNIQYVEFLKKLNRVGVKNRTAEEEAILTISQAIKSAGVTFQEAFAYMDTSGDGNLSPAEFREALRNMGAELTTQQMNNIIRMADVDSDGSIRLEEFVRIFRHKSEKLYDDMKESSHIVALREEDWKQQVFQRVHDAIERSQITLDEAFRKFDLDGNGSIDLTEFHRVFDMFDMNLNRTDINKLFDMMNKDGDDDIQYQEFIRHFREVRDKQRELELLQKETGRIDPDELENIDPRTVAKLREYELRLQNVELKLRSRETELGHQEKSYSKLVAEHKNDKQKYHEARIEANDLHKKLARCISQDESRKITRENELLEREAIEARTGLRSAKEMSDVAHNQVRSLKLLQERKKDEIDTYQKALREFQAQSQESLAVGKMYQQLMYSRWQEALTNRKYDHLMNDNRKMREDNFELEEELASNQDTLYNTERLFKDTSEQNSKKITDLEQRAAHNITKAHADELSAIIRELASHKTELEDLNRKFREERHELRLKADKAEAQANLNEELLSTYKTGNDDEIQTKLLEIGDRMKQVKFKELQAQKDAYLAKEKEEHQSRINTKNMVYIRDIENELADWESKFTRAENDWRRKLAEKQKMLFEKTARKNEPGATATKGVGYLREVSKQQDDVRRLQNQVKNLEQDVRAKTEIIERMEKNYLEDAELFGEGDAAVLRARQTKRTMVQDEEQNKMVEAFEKMVKTLRQMLEEKNAQVVKKEELIKRAHDDAEIQRRHDAEEIKRLTSELNAVNASQYGAAGGSSLFGTQVMDIDDPAERQRVQELMNEKDRRIASLASQKESLSEAHNRVTQENEDLKHQISHLKYDLEQLKAQTEGSSVAERMRRAQDLLKKKDQELKNFKNAIADLRKDLKRAATDTAEKENELRKTTLKTRSDHSEIDNLRQKNRNMDKKLRDIQEKMQTIAHEDNIWKTKCEKLQQELQHNKDSGMRQNHIIDGKQKEIDQANKKVEELQQKLAVKIEDHISVVGSGAVDPTIRTLTERNRFLEGEIVRLKDRMSGVEPLNQTGRKLTNASDVIEGFRRWLRRHPELNLEQLFNRFDVDHSGFINREEFGKALSQLKIYMSDEELNLLVSAMDRNGDDAIGYREFERVLLGRDSVGTMNSMLFELAKKIAQEGLTLDDAFTQINIGGDGFLNLNEFRNALRVFKLGELQENQITDLFNTLDIGKHGRVSSDDFKERIVQAANEMLLDQFREAVRQKKWKLGDFALKFDQYDAGKKSYLTFTEFSSWVKTEGLITNERSIRSLANIVDNDKSNKIEYRELLKALDMFPTAVTGLRASEVPKTDSTSVRGHLQVTFNKVKLSETQLKSKLTSNDYSSDGLVTVSELESILTSLAIPKNEIQIFLGHMDRRTRGMVAYDRMFKKVEETLPTASKIDALLTRLSKTARSQAIHLEEIFSSQDRSRQGKIPAATFKKTLKHVNLGVTDHEIDTIFNAVDDNYGNQLDYKRFINILQDVLKGRDIHDRVACRPVEVSAKPETSQARSKTLGGTQGAKLGSATLGPRSDAPSEAKLRQKINVLNNQVSDMKQEISEKERSVKHWKAQFQKVDTQLREAENRTLNTASRSAAVNRNTSNQDPSNKLPPLEKLENYQEVCDELYSLQVKMSDYEKRVETELKPSLDRTKVEKKELESQLKMKNLDILKLEGKVDALMKKNFDKFGFNEEVQHGHAMKLKAVEEQEQALSGKEKELDGKLLELQQQNMELRFEQQNHEMLYGRLLKRISDLENYRELRKVYPSGTVQKGTTGGATGMMMPTMTTIERAESPIPVRRDSIDSGTSKPRKGAGATIAGAAPSKSVRELETVVASLERVIEKQKTEIDQLRRGNVSNANYARLAKNEKEARARITILEKELREYQAREGINSDMQGKLNKCTEANNKLRRDLNKQIELVKERDEKYRELLLKFSALERENEKQSKVIERYVGSGY